MAHTSVLVNWMKWEIMMLLQIMNQNWAEKKTCHEIIYFEQYKRMNKNIATYKRNDNHESNRYRSFRLNWNKLNSRHFAIKCFYSLFFKGCCFFLLLRNSVEFFSWNALAFSSFTIWNRLFRKCFSFINCQRTTSSKFRLWNKNRRYFSLKQ